MKKLPVEKRAFGREVMILRGDKLSNRLNIFEIKTLLNELNDYCENRLINKPIFMFNTTHKEIVEIYINILENMLND